MIQAEEEVRRGRYVCRHSLMTTPLTLHRGENINEDLNMLWGEQSSLLHIKHMLSDVLARRSVI